MLVRLQHDLKVQQGHVHPIWLTHLPGCLMQVVNWNSAGLSIRMLVCGLASVTISNFLCSTGLLYFRTNILQVLGRNSSAFSDPASELTWHHFRCILLVTRKLLGSAQIQERGRMDPTFQWEECSVVCRHALKSTCHASLRVPALIFSNMCHGDNVMAVKFLLSSL